MNRLAAETSPYLRQHADNPVDWFPWGDEAFESARTLDRPVFLSIGYSACHWCHVMAHESFEDPATAGMLNDAFVCVKVDREERPDVDQVYMEAVQALTGSGGWPMSVFLTPDGRPFFGGTYFPPDDRRGMPSFRTVLAAVGDVWEHRRDEVDRQAEELCRSMAARTAPPARSTPPIGGRGSPASTPGTDLLDAAASELESRFDPRWGGFSGAPKFPQPALVDLALRHACRHRGQPEGDRTRRMAETTLDGMAAGGIHDHIGGGFARYSTDERWLVPHFEKMLYDQASLLRAFLHGWLVSGRADYRTVMEGIVDYVERDLTAPEGGLYSAEDADSEGVEGKFYVWSLRELEEALDQDDPGSPRASEAAARFFGVTEGGNWEGRTILCRPLGEALVGDEAVEAARRRLREIRARRVRPGLDDKVLTEWNAMYASALAESAAATGEPQWTGRAVGIGEFLLGNLRRDDGRWLRSWQREGGARHLACAGDYAWLVDCFTRLGELTGKARWTREAVAVADAMLTLFLDEEGGGFFTTGHDAEELVVRTKDLFDGATPSSNAVAADTLARLGALTGDGRYTAAASGVVEMFGSLLAEHPLAFAQTALTADALAEGAVEVVVAGDRPDLLEVVRGRWMPTAVLAWGEPTPSPLWQDRDAGRAYVCRAYACRLPAEDPATLAAQLDEVTAPAGAR